MEDFNVKKTAHSSQSDPHFEEDYEFLEDLLFDEFSTKLDILEIRIDVDTTNRLFNALTLSNKGSGTLLNLTSFEIFIETCQAKDEDLQKVNKYLPINKLRTSEFALKVSTAVVVPKAGMWYIILINDLIQFKI